ncbi:MAG TPA: hypothetical protein VGL29_05705 [Blastocatellia bacterium]
MTNQESKVTTDPELRRQLQAASSEDDAVEAVFTLSPEDSSQGFLSPERTEELTRQVLERVKSRVGRGEEKLNIFRNLGSFVVSAHPEFLRELMAQPEISTAMANRRAENEIDQPLKERP